MIGYVEGTVSHAFTDSCFVNVGGVGYRVFIASSTRNRLKIGQQARLFTYLSVREDAMTLYGFLTQEEYDLFMHLTGISGIGPKVALGILSAIEPQAFCKAVGQKQASVLVKLPGIGKKTAERIIVELHDKLGQFAAADDEDTSEDITIESAGETDEVVQALVGLGYTQAEVLPVIRRLDLSQPIEILIKQALREFMKG
ncbi:MAG: Holliday junction branch migration protein RuvA [Selenomonadales bacterium]|nr:Holliday junction branch migration protein RuvA [Selenomonadales bacterium]